MTRSEAHLSAALLRDHTDRTESCGADTEGGWCLTAYWLDGGQRLFYTIEEVRDWLEDYEKRTNP